MGLISKTAINEIERIHKEILLGKRWLTTVEYVQVGDNQYPLHPHGSTTEIVWRLTPVGRHADSRAIVIDFNSPDLIINHEVWNEDAEYHVADFGSGQWINRSEWVNVKSVELELADPKFFEKTEKTIRTFVDDIERINGNNR